MYSPAGFRRAPLLRHRRGMGDAASDYASIAAKLTPGSAMYQLFSGCAANPTAPACASATAGALQGPYLTADQEAAVRSAQAAGAIPPTFAATVGPPPGTKLPTPTAPVVITVGSPGGDVALQGASSSPPQQTVTPVVATPVITQPVMVQPANAPNPTNTAQTQTPGFFSQTAFGIPVWILLAAGVGAFFVFGQQGGHYGR